MDGEVLSASKHKPCAGRVPRQHRRFHGVQKVSSLWRRLIIGGASDAPAKILAANSLPDQSPAMRRVWSDRWPG
jgi:hypothetical protein